MGFSLENIKTNPEKIEQSRFDLDSFLKKEITLFKSPFSNKTKEAFYTELSVLLKAGITLKDALALTEASQKKKNTKAILVEMNKNVISGLSFSEAIDNLKYFSSYEYHSLRIGEETGALNQVLDQLADYFTRKNEQKRQLISALSYPIIVCGTAIVVLVFMLNFVVPIFEDIFRQQGVELPGITKFIISCSDFFKEKGFLIFFIIGTLVTLVILLRKKQWFRRAKDNLALKIPILGDFIKTIYLAQFTQAVALLTASRVPLVNSINLVSEMINFSPLQRSIKQVENDIMYGSTLSESLVKHDFFDDRMVALVKVAEETNNNEFIFNRLNTHYNSMVQQKSKIMSTVLEPLIIIFVGVMVAIILVAMYLPMFRLSSVLG